MTLWLPDALEMASLLTIINSNSFLVIQSLHIRFLEFRPMISINNTHPYGEYWGMMVKPIGLTPTNVSPACIHNSGSWEQQHLRLVHLYYDEGDAMTRFVRDIKWSYGYKLWTYEVGHGTSSAPILCAWSCHNFYSRFYNKSLQLLLRGPRMNDSTTSSTTKWTDHLG